MATAATLGLGVIRTSNAALPLSAQSASVPTISAQPLFKRFFENQTWRSEFNGFLTHILMQLDVKKFDQLITSILAKQNIQTDADFYAELSKRIGEAKNGWWATFRAKLRSLWQIKVEMTDQMRQLMGKQKIIRGYVELGYSGRFIKPLQKEFQMQGSFVVVNEQRGLGDYVEAGFPLPYHHFVKLDYAPLAESQIASASTDLVTCGIGLHHCPPNQLDAFVASVARVVRPGGSLLLVDHDVRDDKVMAMAQMAHTVFNAAFGVSTQEEQTEVRNFQPLQVWIAVLEKAGFKCINPKASLVRKGDPSQNGMLRFVKVPKTEEEFRASLRSQPSYVRAQYQTYLTAPEWQNVAATKLYAQFLQQKPAHQFHWFSHVATFWKVFGHCWKAARAHSSFKEMASSDYTVMNLFIGTFMTVEYVAKGILALPKRLVFGNRQGLPVEKEVMEEYAAFIDHTPFYLFPYFSKIKAIWESFQTEWRKQRSTASFSAVFFSRQTLLNLWTAAELTAEYIAKGVISYPITKIYQSEANKEPETIQLLVRTKKNLNSIPDAGGSIKILGEFGDLKHIEIPRYLPGTATIAKLAKHGVEFVEMAGQDKVQLKVTANDATMIPNLKELSRWSNPSEGCMQQRTLEVPIAQLAQAICSFEGCGVTLAYVHDF